MGKFFTFDQNNSGGGFDFDADAGISHYVIIEADDEQHAVYLAGRIGLYFNGCQSGQDCSCCGDRWSTPWNDGTDVPELYGEPLDQVTLTYQAMNGKPEVFVHYADKRIEAHLAGEPAKVK